MSHEILSGMYHIRNTIGSGGFAKVKLGYHCGTGEKVAIKIMNKHTLGKDLPRVKTEIEAMKALNHRNVCRLYQIFETEDFFYIVLEYCQGGELFDYIVSKDKLSETEARMVFRQIVDAVAYIHGEGFIHRDLKPENLLLDEDQNIKLIDFGLCAKPEGGLEEALKTCCGSPAYAAPELILGKNYMGTQVDLWSLGVLLYTLLCGFLPFDDNNLNMLYRKIVNGKFSTPKWLSKESTDLLKGMLQVNPTRRFTISEVIAHPWLNRGFDFPIVPIPSFQADNLDEECITEMSVHYGITRHEIKSRVSQWSYDYITSTYLLLLRKKEQGKSIRLNRNHVLKVTQLQDGQPKTPSYNDNQLKDTSNIRDVLRQPIHPLKHDDKKDDDDDDDGVDVIARYSAPVHTKPKCVQALFTKEEVPAAGDDGRKERMEGSDRQEEEKKENFVFIRPRTPKARHRPVTEGAAVLQGAKKQHIPLVVPHVGTPRPPTRLTQMDHFIPFFNPLSPSRSFDSQLHNLSNNGENISTSDQTMHQGSSMDQNLDHTPSRSRRMAASVFGSIERGMDKLIGMLTPKRKNSNPESPRMVKSIHNVSNICKRSAEEMVQELEAIFKQNDIKYKRNGFLLSGKHIYLDEKLKFNMEIVVLKSSHVGISRKRVKGSAWLYKTTCEKIFGCLKSTY